MRILQVCIGNPFTPTMYYKENYLLDAFLEAGHTPLILADTTAWQDGKIVMVPAGDTTLENGVRVVRVDLGHGFLIWLFLFSQMLCWSMRFSSMAYAISRNCVSGCHNAGSMPMSAQPIKTVRKTGCPAASCITAFTGPGFKKAFHIGIRSSM